jgi:hypothetical protein
MVIHNIVELASEAGLEGVNKDNIEELLQSHGKSLTNDELRELAQQRIQSELQPLMQKRTLQYEKFLQNLSAKASLRSLKSWTSS